MGLYYWILLNVVIVCIWHAQKRVRENGREWEKVIENERKCKVCLLSKARADNLSICVAMCMQNSFLLSNKRILVVASSSQYTYITWAACILGVFSVSATTDVSCLVFIKGWLYCAIYYLYFVDTTVYRNWSLVEVDEWLYKRLIDLQCKNQCSLAYIQLEYAYGHH